MRVIADHVRATSFLVADGVLPSNEGRGYVLRRVYAAGHPFRQESRAFAGPFMHQACLAVVESMLAAYPHLSRYRSTARQGGQQ